MKKERAEFLCPGCGRKLSGEYRYCSRCETKRQAQAAWTRDGFKQLPLFVSLKEER